MRRLIDVQTDLAWQLLNQVPTPLALTRQQFLSSSKPIRLDAFENYIRGILATNRQQKTKYFREAIRLNPNYTLAMLQLGRLYYDGHEYESAALWLAKIPKDDPIAGEANFLLGMAEFYRGNYDKAYAAFSFLAARLPLTEVYNNLGVVEGRRGRRAASIEHFTKAVTADPSDPDYRFNLAVALYKNGDNAGAAQQLREELQRRRRHDHLVSPIRKRSTDLREAGQPVTVVSTLTEARVRTAPCRASVRRRRRSFPPAGAEHQRQSGEGRAARADARARRYQRSETTPLRAGMSVEVDVIPATAADCRTLVGAPFDW